MSALLSTPRSHVSHHRTDTNVQKTVQTESKLIRFSTPRQLRALLSPDSTLPPSHYCFTTVPTHRRVSHTLCAPTQLLRVDAQCGCAQRPLAAFVEQKKESRAGRGAAAGTPGLGKQTLSGLRQKKEKLGERKKKNDCDAFGRLSGGIRLAGCYRTTAFPCAEDQQDFQEGRLGCSSSSSSWLRTLWRR